jgi:hypothetical protein
LGGGYFPDHIVILVFDPKTKTYEYYNSQGGELKDESRIVLGTGLALEHLVKTHISDEWKVSCNSTVHQTDYYNCGAFIGWFMKHRQTKAFAEICAKDQINIHQERSQLASDLSQYYNPETDANTVYLSDIERHHGRIHERELRDLTQQDIRWFLKQNSTFDREKLFSEIDKKQNRINQGMRAVEIFEDLKKTGKNEEEILTLMTLLQPGIFTSLGEDIWRRFNAVGKDPDFKVQNGGDYLYTLERDESNSVRLLCSTKFTVTDKKHQKATLNAEVMIDTQLGKAIERWNFCEDTL